MAKPQEIWQEHFDAAQKAFDAGNEQEAEKHLAQCAAMSPEAWCGFGYQAMQEGDYQPALNRFREALAFAKRPQTRAACLNNIGSILANVGYRAEAKGYFLQAVKASDVYADSWANLALCAKWDDELLVALGLCRKALKINPHHQSAAFTKSLIMLAMGDMPAGWDAYESRWRNKAAKIRKFEFPKPEWDGRNAAKTVFIYAEQGAGDCIMMMRYIHRIKERGLRVIGAMPPHLAELARWAGFDAVYLPGENMEPFDAHVSIMSLPRIFRTTLETIPHKDGYIKFPPVATMPIGDFNVGICWSGSSAFQHNIWRSTHLQQWSELLAVPGVTWHSFQVGAGEAEADLFPEINTFPTPKDYMETAQRMVNMDLVITIDTSVCHLAGAMGIPVWVLIPAGPDWRWLVGRDDSPWYSSMRLFRQEKEFQWTPVFERLKNELENRST